MNFTSFLWWGPVLVLLAVGVIVFWRIGRRHDPRLKARRAIAGFAQSRPQLEPLFFQAAANSGKPRGLRWKKCDWGSAVEFVRDKSSGQLLALVEVAISFEAIEGGDMEGIEAVSNVRYASAVFFFDNGWSTAGRVIFNLNPQEAVEHFKSAYERVNP